MANYINIPPAGSPSWRAPVADALSLPATGNLVGDAIVTQDTSAIYIWDGASWVSAGGGSGTVTSVDVAAPAALLTSTGGPITSSGTITLDLQTQTAATVLAAPVSGPAAAPTF